MTTYIAITLSGEKLNNAGRGYVTREAARKAAMRRGTVAVETRAMDARLPHANDAAAWDDLRTRNGCPSR